MNILGFAEANGEFHSYFGEKVTPKSIAGGLLVGDCNALAFGLRYGFSFFFFPEPSSTTGKSWV